MPPLEESFFSRSRMIVFLNELEGNNGVARSSYIPFGMSVPQVKGLLEERLEAQAIPAELPGLVVSSRTGGVFFWSPEGSYLVVPPFPISEEYFAHGYAVEPLRSTLRHDFRIALVLVRLGAYAVGVCEGEKLVTSKVGTGLIHGRQRQGGSSAQRFGLRRKEQIHSFLLRVCGHIQEQIGSKAMAPDYMVYGGARTTITLLQKECQLLRQFEGCLLPPLLDIGEPRQAVLEAAVGRVWSSRVMRWHETA